MRRIVQQKLNRMPNKFDRTAAVNRPTGWIGSPDYAARRAASHFTKASRRLARFVERYVFICWTLSWPRKSRTIGRSTPGVSSNRLAASRRKSWNVRPLILAFRQALRQAVLKPLSFSPISLPNGRPCAGKGLSSGSSSAMRCTLARMARTADRRGVMMTVCKSLKFNLFVCVPPPALMRSNSPPPREN